MIPLLVQKCIEWGRELLFKATDDIVRPAERRAHRIWHMRGAVEQANDAATLTVGLGVAAARHQ